MKTSNGSDSHSKFWQSMTSSGPFILEFVSKSFLTGEEKVTRACPDNWPFLSYQINSSIGLRHCCTLPFLSQLKNYVDVCPKQILMTMSRERTGMPYGSRIIRLHKKKFYVIFKLYTRGSKIHGITNGTVRLQSSNNGQVNTGSLKFFKICGRPQSPSCLT